MSRKASLIGATGLIGSHLLKLLEKDSYFDTVTVLVRSPFVSTNSKIQVKQLNFEDQQAFKSAIEGSQAVFCCVGTTQKKVKGDMSAYRKVDFDIPVNAAHFAAETGTEQFLLVSSVGADKASNNFYLKLKGETEEGVEKSKVSCMRVFRPSMLLGNRAEKRPAEKVGQILMKLLSPLIPGNYKPIEASAVASAMMQAAKTKQKGKHIYHYSEMRAGSGN